VKSVATTEARRSRVASATCYLWVDAGYRGEDRGKDWVEKALGWSVELVERPRKPAPKDVLMAWAEQWMHGGVKVDWKKLLPPKGFVVLPREGG
jgi:hypothetical protein